MVKRKSKRSFVKEIEIHPHSTETDSTFLVCPWILGLEHNRKDFSLRVQTYAVVAPEDGAGQDPGEPAPGRFPALCREHGHGQSPGAAEFDQDLVPQVSRSCLKNERPRVWSRQ